jgi:hypothetical protein
MKLDVKGIKAEYVNSSMDYTIYKAMGSPVLVYGDGQSKSKKMRKAVAFKDTNVMREVANNMLKLADFLDGNGN